MKGFISEIKNLINFEEQDEIKHCKKKTELTKKLKNLLQKFQNSVEFQNEYVCRIKEIQKKTNENSYQYYLEKIGIYEEKTKNIIKLARILIFQISKVKEEKEN